MSMADDLATVITKTGTLSFTGPKWLWPLAIFASIALYLVDLNGFLIVPPLIAAAPVLIVFAPFMIALALFCLAMLFFLIYFVAAVIAICVIFIFQSFAGWRAKRRIRKMVAKSAGV